MRSIETLRPHEQDHLHAAVSIETPEESALKDSNYRGSRKASQRLIPFLYPTSFCAQDEECKAGELSCAEVIWGVFFIPLHRQLGEVSQGRITLELKLMVSDDKLSHI